MELFAYILERLKATQDGDGTLLDHSTILYGAALSDGNQHSNYNLPLLVAGHAVGQRGGRHVAAKALTPAANPFVNMLDRVGVAAEALATARGCCI